MSSITETYRNGVYRMAEMFVQQYKREGEQFLKSIVLFQSICSALCEVYAELVKEKKCKPIEELEHSEKMELFEETKRLGATIRKTIIQVCKALHALGSYMQMKK